MKGKAKTAVMILLLSVFIIQISVAQDAGENTFAQNLVRTLERYGWETSETGELERHMRSYEWKNLQGVDPAAVAHALSYGKENGSFSADELAEMAYQLALSAGELIRLGFQPREVLLAATNAVRTMTVNRVRTGEETANLPQTFREQLRRQINGTQESSLQRKTQRQISRPERPETWTPPSPGERQGNGRSDIPGGPGDSYSSGSTTEPPMGNGGR
jgi:hypothetical protein